MEKNIVDYFKKVLSSKNGHLSMNSFKGHLAELSQKERKHIKKFGLEKLLNKHKEFVLCEDEIYLIPEEKEETESNSSNNNKAINASNNISHEKPSMVDLRNAEDDPCTVCSDRIEIFAIGECRHPICYRCSTKLRVLCEDKNCPVCRQTLDMVVFSKKLLPVDEHDVDNYIRDKKYGIAFENAKICEQKGSLLRHICTNCQPHVNFETFAALEDHAKSKHHRYYCDICVRQCKIFTDERKTYSKSELEKHMEYGDEAGSARGGHPLCKFCTTRYLDNDELHRHLRLHHCSCAICDEENEGLKNYQFYVDGGALAEHQWEKHYVCKQPECIDTEYPVAFRNEIDLQSHTLQKHSDNKTKMEKRQEQRIEVPFVLEERIAKQQRILKVTPDAAGGIHCTGSVSRRIERSYSFMERDDAPGQFEENVFFDLEACGLEPSDDLRDRFTTGDRVSVYAIPAHRANSKSKWKALKLERISDAVYNDPFGLQQYITHSSSYNPNPYGTMAIRETEIGPNDFPTLSPRFQAAGDKSTALAGWSTMAKTMAAKPMSLSPYNKRENTTVKANYETGFVHKNISKTYGFITKEKLKENFSENVYFDWKAYRAGMGIRELIDDLTSVLKIGEKVCYTLDRNGPMHQNVKTKLRADRVWKFSGKAEDGAGENVNQITANELSNIPRPKAKVKATEPGGIDLDALAEKYKKLLQMKSDKKGASLSQDSDASSENQMNPMEETIFSGLSVAATLGETSKFNTTTSRKTEVRLNGHKPENKTSVASLSHYAHHLEQEKLDTNKNPSASFIKKLSKIQHTESLRSYSSSDELSIEDESLAHANLSRSQKKLDSDDAILTAGKVVVMSERSKDGKYDSLSSDEMYSSEDESEDDETDEPDIMDSCGSVFMDTIDICLKNKGLYKILRRQMSMEMINRGVRKPNDLQFVEFRKEENTVYVMFFVALKHSPQGSTGDMSNRVKTISSQYAKLDGFYPLESAWLGELKSKNMINKIFKDLYHITNSCHYVTVQRNKSDKISKVIVHYRPSPGEC